MKRDLHVYLYEYQWNHGGMLCMQCGLYSCVLVSFVGLFSYMRWKETYKRDQHTWNAISDRVAQNLEIICKTLSQDKYRWNRVDMLCGNLSEDAANTISQRMPQTQSLRGYVVWKFWERFSLQTLSTNQNSAHGPYVITRYYGVAAISRLLKIIGLFCTI